MRSGSVRSCSLVIADGAQLKLGQSQSRVHNYVNFGDADPAGTVGVAWLRSGLGESLVGAVAVA